MERMMSFFIAGFVLLLALAWIYIIRKPLKKTTSARKFTVTLSQGWRIATFVVSPISMAFAVFFYLLGFWGFDDYTIMVIIMAAVSILFFPVMWTGIVLKRLDVDLDTLRHRNSFGRVKRISADQIEKVVIETDESFTIYANGKNFGNFGKELLHVDNFYQYCEKRDIVIQKEQGKPITKWMLMRGIFKLALIIGIGVGAFFGIIALILHFTGGLYADAPAGEAPLITLGIIVLVAVILLPGTMRSILRIRKQEKTLGFCFRDEMKKHNITKFGQANQEWFVGAGNMTFRRDFIVSMGEGKELSGRMGAWSQIVFLGADGKNYKVKDITERVALFAAWYASAIEGTVDIEMKF